MVPWRPSKSWRAPRTAPSTVPSIFTTPVLSISPTIFIPDAITDNPASGRGASFRIGTFSVAGFVKINISTYGGCGRSIEGSCGRQKSRNGFSSVRDRRRRRWCVAVGPFDVRRYCGRRSGILGLDHTATDREHLSDLLVAAVH